MTTPPFFIKHLRTEYTGDQATIYFARAATAPDGSVLMGIPEALPTTQAALGTLAVANGADASRWGDQEVGQTLGAAIVVDKDAIPAQDAVMDGDTVVTPAVATVPAVTHLLCGGLPIEF